MRICFCDDEKSFHAVVENMIQKWSKEKGVLCEVFHYDSAEQMLFENEQNFSFDLILLDIQMGKMDGVELARKIRERDNHVMIAFLTAVGDHVFEGYEVQAVRYLMKPLQQEKLSELLELAAKASQNNRKYLILEVSGEKEKIYLEDVLAIESQGHYLNFHTMRGNLEQKGTLATVGEKLDDSFVQSHRSFFVNLSHVVRITKTECSLDNGETIPVSRGAYKKLNEEFIRFYQEAIL